MIHQWHVVLFFGVIVGYALRALQDRIMRARKRARAYHGRWPVMVIAAATLTTQGCGLLPKPRVSVKRTVTVTRTVTRVCVGKRCPAKNAEEDLEKDAQEAKHFLDLQFARKLK